uniref:Cytochrome c oxidase subunit 2 n=1 Tax=Antigona lamellaris TaxID=345433 RepID=A0A866UCJ2_9BIVA|nr:cytochrome c oxidase subunit 2 [Antigona lamellaris]
MSGVFFDGSLNLYVHRSEALETFWTVTPAFFLVALGYVSLKNLYDMEVGDYVGHTVKVIGHQWYWEYYYEVNFNKDLSKGDYLEYLNEFLGNISVDGFWLYASDLDGVVNLDELVKDSFYSFDVALVGLNLKDGDWVENSIFQFVAGLYMKGDWFLGYDAYVVPESDLIDESSDKFGLFRNQSSSWSCLLAYEKKNEILVSTADVMHSWGVGELGVKADAVPGRCNSLSVEPVMPGSAFGNCYELCGEGHSEMPIVVNIMSYKDLISNMKMEIFRTEDCEEFFSKLFKV